VRPDEQDEVGLFQQLGVLEMATGATMPGRHCPLADVEGR